MTDKINLKLSKTKGSMPLDDVVRAAFIEEIRRFIEHLYVISDEISDSDQDVVHELEDIIEELEKSFDQSLKRAETVGGVRIQIDHALNHASGRFREVEDLTEGYLNQFRALIEKGIGKARRKIVSALQDEVKEGSAERPVSVSDESFELFAMNQEELMALARYLYGMKLQGDFIKHMKSIAGFSNKLQKEWGKALNISYQNIGAMQSGNEPITSSFIKRVGRQLAEQGGDPKAIFDQFEPLQEVLKDLDALIEADEIPLSETELAQCIRLTSLLVDSFGSLAEAIKKLEWPANNFFRVINGQVDIATYLAEDLNNKLQIESDEWSDESRLEALMQSELLSGYSLIEAKAMLNGFYKDEELAGRFTQHFFDLIAKGKTYEQLSSLLGWGMTTFSALKKGRTRVQFGLLMKAVFELDIPLADFFNIPEVEKSDIEIKANLALDFINRTQPGARISGDCYQRLS